MITIQPQILPEISLIFVDVILPMINTEVDKCVSFLAFQLRPSAPSDFLIVIYPTRIDGAHRLPYMIGSAPQVPPIPRIYSGV